MKGDFISRSLRYSRLKRFLSKLDYIKGHWKGYLTRGATIQVTACPHTSAAVSLWWPGHMTWSHCYLHFKMDVCLLQNSSLRSAAGSARAEIPQECWVTTLRKMATMGLKVRWASGPEVDVGDWVSFYHSFWVTLSGCGVEVEVCCLSDIVSLIKDDQNLQKSIFKGCSVGVWTMLPLLYFAIRQCSSYL